MCFFESIRSCFYEVQLVQKKFYFVWKEGRLEKKGQFVIKFIVNSVFLKDVVPYVSPSQGSKMRF